MEQLSFDFSKVQPFIVAEERGDGENLKLCLGEFAGPLDLLLHLIKQEQANIFDIPIARITDVYLDYLRLMKEFDIAVAGDFLVMAATLIEIKSKMLLPHEESLFDEETTQELDPRAELAQKLLEHQKFKNAAAMLWEKAIVEQSIFNRGQSETDQDNFEVNASIFDLLTTFQKILARQTEEIKLEIEREETTLAEVLADLRQKIQIAGKIALRELFACFRTKREIVLTFLAVLELVKMAEIKLRQDETFGDIIAQKT
jgi:segregation and condensation protein A